MIRLWARLSAGWKAFGVVAGIAGASVWGSSYFATKAEVAPLRDAVQSLRVSSASQAASVQAIQAASEATQASIQTLLTSMLQKPPPRGEEP